MRVCPDCHVDLRQEMVGPVTVDFCPQCAGVLFDDGEICQIARPGPDQLAELEQHFVPQIEPHAPAGKTVRLCPACQAGMEAYRYLYSSPVMLDECPKCHAVWVENGELSAMSKALESSLHEAVNPRLEALMHHQAAVMELEEKAAIDSERHKMFQRVMSVLMIRRYRQV